MKNVNEYIQYNIKDIILEKQFGDYYRNNKHRFTKNFWSDLGIIGSFLLGSTVGVVVGLFAATAKSIKRRTDSSGKYVPYSQRNYLLLKDGDEKILNNIQFSKLKNKKEFDQYLSVSQTNTENEQGFYQIKSLNDSLESVDDKTSIDKGYFFGTIKEKNDISILCLGIMIKALVEIDGNNLPILFLELERKTPNIKKVFNNLFDTISNTLQTNKSGIIIGILNDNDKKESIKTEDIIKNKNFIDISNDCKFIIDKNDSNKNEEFDTKIKKIIGNTKLFIHKKIKDESDKLNENN